MNKIFLRIVTNYGRNFSTVPSSVKKPSSNNRTAQLKQMLLSPKLEFIMEAHSALSAKIVEETGFKVSRIIFQIFSVSHIKCTKSSKRQPKKNLKHLQIFFFLLLLFSSKDLYLFFFYYYYARMLNMFMCSIYLRQNT